MLFVADIVIEVTDASIKEFTSVEITDVKIEDYGIVDEIIDIYLASFNVSN